jgi:hypothetical protein
VKENPHTTNTEEAVAKAKKSTTAGYVAIVETAPIETPAPVPAPAEPIVAEQNGPKRKGKAPGEKTLIVRAGIADHPDLLPKELADLLNQERPGFNITNNDISQQRQQLKLRGGKSGKTKAKKVAAEKVVAVAETVIVKAAPAKVGGDIRQVADLAKHLGTAKIRELCDLIDYVTK